MTLPLVPAPAIAELHDGNLVVRDGSPLVVGSAELIPVAKQFIEDVRIDTGITLALDNQAEAPVITVALDVTDLGAVAVAQGIRADGASAADERYGLRITADNVHVWAATAEGVYRALTSRHRWPPLCVARPLARRRARLPCSRDAAPGDRHVRSAQAERAAPAPHRRSGMAHRGAFAAGAHHRWQHRGIR
ncbi:hypothetical protein FZI90_13500 [Mycobacterium sp. CBMA334]|nr:hypothetical protein [Mycolicibacterium sp. CBMA 334]